MHEPERFRSPEYLSVINDTPMDSKCRLSESVLRTLQQVAEAGYPHEVCGLLVGTSGDDWHVKEAREVANLNSERAADRFELDPAAYQVIDRELRGSGNEIIGVFHSHPDCPAKPSPTDLGSAWEGFLYPIVSVHGGHASDIRCWALSEQGETRCFQPVSIVMDKA